MASKWKTLGILGALVAVGGLALASADAAENPDGAAPETGLEVSADCRTVDVVDVELFRMTFEEWMLDYQAEHPEFEGRQRQRVGRMIREFLVRHFPDCFTLEASGGTASSRSEPAEWHTPTLGGEHVRTWGQLVADVQEALLTVPPDYDVDDPDAPLFFAYAAEVAATSPASSSPDEGEPEDDRPLPPIPPFDPDGDGLGSEGGGGDIVPENVVAAISAQHMMDAGVRLAMEHAPKAVGPIESSIVIVYDPQWEHAASLIDTVTDAAQAHGEILFVLADVNDTKAAFGRPEELGVLGAAINATDRNGHYFTDEARAFAYDGSGPTQQMWRRLLAWAKGPTVGVPPTVPFGISGQRA